MTLKEYALKKYTWMSNDQFDCFVMLCDLFGGDHHVTGSVKEHATSCGVFNV